MRVHVIDASAKECLFVVCLCSVLATQLLLRCCYLFVDAKILGF